MQDHGYTQNDVLCERGGLSNNHQGNIDYLNLVRERAPQFTRELSSNRQRCREFLQSIVDEIRRRGGRFMEQVSTDHWEEIDDRRARKKVCQKLRDFRRQEECRLDSFPFNPPDFDDESIGGVSFGPEMPDDLVGILSDPWTSIETLLNIWINVMSD